MARDDATGTIAMTEAEAERFLESNGHGVIGLADGDRAYTIPISYGYDGDRLFLYFIQFGDSGEKFAYSGADGRVSLTVYDVETEFDWRSVNVAGSLRGIDGDEREYAERVIDERAWQPSLFPPTDAMTGVEWLELEIDEIAGRKGEEYQ